MRKPKAECGVPQELFLVLLLFNDLSKVSSIVKPTDVHRYYQSIFSHKGIK